MVRSIRFDENKEFGGTVMIQKKYYLVACYNKRDALNTLLRTYSKMQKDFTKKQVSYSENTMTIQNEDLLIVFVTAEQLRNFEPFRITYNGVDHSNGFVRRVASNTMNVFRYSYLKQTRIKYQINDKDGILSMYVYKGGTE